MRPVENAALIQRWVEESGVRGYFDTPHLVFQAYSFEKGEYITSPDVPMDKLLFCIRGTIQIYGIRDDGGISPIGLARSPAILGDVEFGNGGKTPFFSQAKTNALCLALSTREYSEQLHRDLRFLHCLLRFYGEKLERFSTQSVTGTTVEQRGLQYLEKGDAPAELIFKVDGVIDHAEIRMRLPRPERQLVLFPCRLERLIARLVSGGERPLPPCRGW